MLRATWSAWIALRRPSVLWSTLAAAGAFSALATAVSFLNASDVAARAEGGPPGADVTRATLALPDGIVTGLTQAATFLGIVGIVCGASAAAADFQHGTLRTLLVRQPDRVRLLAGKLLATTALLAAAAGVATIVAVAGAVLLAGGADVDTARWSAAEVVLGGLRAAAAMAGFGIVGAALGVALRTPVAAIGVGVSWVLAVEQLLGSAWGGAGDVLPGKLLAAVAHGSANAIHGLASLAWAIAAAAGAAALLSWRDVTA